MAGVDLPFACDCNKLRGTLLGASPSNGSRIECYCGDCRAAELYAGQPDPAPGAVQLYQTVLYRVRIDAGADQIAPFSLSPKGPLRWQARCCGATVFLTARSPRLCFASFRTDRLEDDSPLGPLIGQAFVTKPNGKVGHNGLVRLIWGFATRTLGARITGKWKNTTFFKADGSPVADVHVISKSERDVLMAR